MGISSFANSINRGVTLTGLALGISTLAGCYVVPLNNAPGYAPAPYAAPVVVSPATFAARLYPANDAAQAYGMVSAVVTNDLHGRGTFSTSINGESFTGEATRVSHSERDGIANGAGNRGSFINCTYKMNSTTLGTGTCKMSNGAVFNMHVGS
jgi:hypothetical protein